MNSREFILDSRKKLGLTQVEFAKLLGVSPNAVQKWESAKQVRKPSATATIAIKLILEKNQV